MRRGLGLAGRHGACCGQRLFFGFELFADLGADAHQVGARRLRVAAAETQPHAGLGVVGNGDAAPRRVEADDVAHQHVGAQVAGAADAVAARVGQADQRVAHGVDGFLRPVERHLQVGQQHVERWLAVERQQQVAVGLGDLALARAAGAQRLAALRDARHQPHALAEHHARQAAREHATRRTVAADVAVAADRELQRPAAAGREPAEQVAGVGAARHLADELAQVGRGRVGVHERGVRLEAAHFGAAQRRHAREHAVLVAGQRAQHQAQAGLVEVLGVVGRHADADGARPVGDLGQFGAQVIEDLLRLGRVVVGDVEQPERRVRRVIGQRHLRAQLGQHKAGGHAPLRVGGMAGGKQFHGAYRPVRRRLERCL
ncbi:hypothetical protein D3C72_1282450 [compost metagenome]